MKKFWKKIQLQHRHLMAKHIIYFCRPCICTAAIVLIGLFFHSCSKDSELGTEAFSDDILSGVQVYDSIHVLTSTEYQSRIKVFSSTNFELQQLFNVAPFYPLGGYHDEQTGKAYSDLIYQVEAPELILSNTQLNSLIIDSVVCSFKLNDSYGFDDPISFKVYELTTDLDASQDYYSDDNFMQGTLLGQTAEIIVSATDSVLVNGDTESPQLRISIDPQFGYTLLDNAINNSDNFKDVIKGFYVQIDSSSIQNINTGSVYSLDLLDLVSGIHIYYQLDGESQNPIRFPIEDESIAFNLYHNSFSQEVMDAVTLQSETEKIFVKSMQGLRVKVALENLDILHQDSVFISKAEIVFPVHQSTDVTILPPHDQLRLVKEIDEELYQIEDYSLGLTHYGGSYDIVTNSYTFNITRFIQNFLKDEEPSENPIVYLIPNGLGIYDPVRTVLNGSNHTNKPYVKIYYFNI